MCGIAGLFALGSSPPAPALAETLAARARLMAARLSHRGPDDEGLYLADNAGLALAHRRLSIIDLAPTGHQPMVSADGRYVIAFNGEIYNFRTMRAGLGAMPLRGQSDTEVLLETIARFGLEAALERAIGMFAFALWDTRARTLSLVRDRLGVKPLSYGWVDGQLAFASELGAFEALPGFPRALDHGALADYTLWGYVPAPRTIWRGVRKLAPGHVLTIAADSAPGVELTPQPYWSFNALVARSASAALHDEGQALEALDALLRDSIRLRMISDVPLGVFLSGGLDSSLVTALMQQEGVAPAKSFTATFAYDAFDEGPHAAAVARHLGTVHSAFHVGDAEALETAQALGALFDEPFADPSALPSVLIARHARSSVTVALSGDGGDELFAGYPRYLKAERLARQLKGVPRALRVAATHALDSLPEELSTRLGIGPHRAGRLRALLRPEAAPDFYTALVAQRGDAARILPSLEARSLVSHWPGALPLLPAMMAADSVTYLPDDILVKVDRATMAAGLEAREPLLDHRLVEWAWSLAPALRRPGKGLLRTLLARHVPSALTDRPKQGFGVPLGPWLRGPLRAWGEALLAGQALADLGLFDLAYGRRLWAAHQARHIDASYPLWNTLMLAAWLEAR